MRAEHIQRNKAEAATSTRNKYIQAVKAAFRWARKKGSLPRNPIADSDGLTREKHAQRDRRLAPDVLNADGKIEQDGEERRLLAVASPYANLSQTSTYLNVTRIGLHESMRRLDESASRGKAVATETQTDPPPSGNEAATEAPKVVVN